MLIFLMLILLFQIKKISILSDSNGNFNINKIIELSDTIYFNSPGYIKKSLTFSDMNRINNNIQLDKEIIELKEVEIIKNLKNDTIGYSKKGNLTIRYTDDTEYIGEEQGVILSIKKTIKLKQLNFFISSNEFKTVKLRLNLYKIENGKPTDLINTEDIIFDVKDSFKGWFRLDLKDYNIIINKNINNIGATLQWLEGEKNNDTSSKFGLLGSSSFKKNTIYKFLDYPDTEWKLWGLRLSFFFTVQEIN